MDDSVQGSLPTASSTETDTERVAAQGREKRETRTTPNTVPGKAVHRVVMLVAYDVDFEEAFERAREEYAEYAGRELTDEDFERVREIAERIIDAAESDRGFNHGLDDFQ
jgi:hypothetical protein